MLNHIRHIALLLQLCQKKQCCCSYTMVTDILATFRLQSVAVPCLVASSHASSSFYYFLQQLLDTGIAEDSDPLRSRRSPTGNAAEPPSLFSVGWIRCSYYLTMTISCFCHYWPAMKYFTTKILWSMILSSTYTWIWGILLYSHTPKLLSWGPLLIVSRGLITGRRPSLIVSKWTTNLLIRPRWMMQHHTKSLTQYFIRDELHRNAAV